MTTTIMVPELALEHLKTVPDVVSYFGTRMSHTLGWVPSEVADETGRIPLTLSVREAGRLDAGGRTLYSPNIECLIGSSLKRDSNEHLNLLRAAHAVREAFVGTQATGPITVSSTNIAAFLGRPALATRFNFIGESVYDLRLELLSEYLVMNWECNVTQ